MTSATNEHISNQQEIDLFIEKYPEWLFEDNRLKADFSFETFEQAIAAINQIAEVASGMDHHPALTNVYNRLSFLLCTHSLGDVVTSLDIQLAEKISNIIATGKK